MSNYDPSASPYTPEKLGTGCHAVAKVCLHETLHLQMDSLCNSVTDSDTDGLPDNEETRLGTIIGIKDTYNVHKAYEGDISLLYKEKGDQELYCREHQKSALGVESNDWGWYYGAQFYDQK